MHRDSKITCITKSIAPIKDGFGNRNVKIICEKQCIDIILLGDLSKGLKEENDG